MCHIALCICKSGRTWDLYDFYAHVCVMPCVMFLHVCENIYEDVSAHA
jgi:hypothetical protein